MSKTVAILVSIAGLMATGPALAQWPTYTVEQPFDWEVSTPEQQGLDARMLRRALRRGKRLPFLRALLVVKDGHLVAERYYRGSGATDANTVMSVSKSFISALVGIAVREGHLRRDQRLMEFFPDYANPDMDPRKLRITIRQLLTMTSGLPFDDHAEHWNRWMPSNDWVGFCLDLPLDGDPGEVWNYSTCGTHLLSAVLTRATGRSTYEFAEENLFEPLGITIGGWREDPHGIYRGGWDMYFTPRDMARFGYLFLRNGKVSGDRILTRRWVRQSTRPFVTGDDEGVIEERGYGYLWWTARGERIHEMYYAAGYGGQLILNIPELQITIVTATDANYDWEEAGEHFDALAELVIDDLLVPLKERSERD